MSSKLDEAYEVWSEPIHEDKTLRYSAWDEWWGPIDGMPDKAFEAGFLHAIEIAEAECKTVVGRVTHHYRGDSMTANELLEVLKRYAGLTKEPTNEE